MYALTKSMASFAGNMALSMFDSQSQHVDLLHRKTWGMLAFQLGTMCVFRKQRLYQLKGKTRICQDSTVISYTGIAVEGERYTRN